jgi:hypothetical protein
MCVCVLCVHMYVCVCVMDCLISCLEAAYVHRKAPRLTVLCCSTSVCLSSGACVCVCVCVCVHVCVCVCACVCVCVCGVLDIVIWAGIYVQKMSNAHTGVCVCVCVCVCASLLLCAYTRLNKDPNGNQHAYVSEIQQQTSAQTHDNLTCPHKIMKVITPTLHMSAGGPYPLGALPPAPEFRACSTSGAT